VFAVVGLVRISGRGRSRAISTSKIRKITARRKNRRENGVRAEWFGSNPHSYGLAFSRLFWTRMDVAADRRIKAPGINKERIAEKINSFISSEAIVCFHQFKRLGLRCTAL